jgi:hypothetical protein
LDQPTKTGWGISFGSSTWPVPSHGSFTVFSIRKNIQKETELMYFNPGWRPEIIEYSIVLDDQQQAHWKSYWLDAFVAQHGKLPIYNRIGGATRRAASEG